MPQAWYPDEPEEKVEDKVEEEKRDFPWADPQTEDPNGRVVGWRDGVPITKASKRELMRKERLFRQQYRDDKKVLSASRQREAEEHVQLPPTWQALWSTVPNLDAQAVYRQHCREEQRRQTGPRDQGSAPTTAGTVAGSPEAIEDEIMRLESEIRKKKEVYNSKKQVADGWDRRVARLRAMDKQEEEDYRRFLRNLQHASYQHGVAEGHKRSSDIYFQFLYEDTKKLHHQKVANLKRSCALMCGAIDEMKAEVRKLLKVAADIQAVEEAVQAPSGRPGSVAPSSASGGGSEDEEEEATLPGATVEPK